MILTRHHRPGLPLVGKAGLALFQGLREAHEGASHPTSGDARR